MRRVSLKRVVQVVFLAVRSMLQAVTVSIATARSGIPRPQGRGGDTAFFSRFVRIGGLLLRVGADERGQSGCVEESKH